MGVQASPKACQALLRDGRAHRLHFFQALIAAPFAFAAPFSSLPRPDPSLRACVVIPARDEARNIETALSALACSRDGAGPLDPARFEILLLCNNCRDQTAQVARDFAARHPLLALHVAEVRLDEARANIGTARRLLMDAACARLESLPTADFPRFIASTDADTRVEPAWLRANECELRAGADAVGGRVLVENDGSPARRAYLFDTAYRLLAARLESALDPQPFDLWPRHFQFFGASLALTPRAYRAVGGLPHTPHLEDVALERALMRADIPLRHSPLVRVHTQARQRGRVALGLSTQLRQWKSPRAANLWLVPSGEEIASQARFKARLRAAFGAPAVAWSAVANEANCSSAQLKHLLDCAPTFGALWDEVRSLPERPHWSPVPVECAIARLRAMLAQVRA